MVVVSLNFHYGGDARKFWSCQVLLENGDERRADSDYVCDGNDVVDDFQWSLFMMFMFIMVCKDCLDWCFFMLSGAEAGDVLDNNNALDHDDNEDDDVHDGLQGCVWTNAFSCWATLQMNWWAIASLPPTLVHHQQIALHAKVANFMNAVKMRALPYLVG